MWKRAIIHSDINHCYAQIEEMKCPSLRDVPMAVGGHEESRHGIILARNDLAKEYGVKTAETLRDAYKKCPNLVIVHPNYKDYEYYTTKVKNIYREYSDQVESFGLDEAWIDITSSQLLFGEPIDIAKTIQARVLNEIGLRVSIGLSYNKIFAKLGSDRIKKSGLFIITEDNYKEKVWPLEIGELFYVGRATKEKLLNKRINTIGDLANLTTRYLNDLLGKNGEMLWYFANGYDVSEVAINTYQREVKSISNGITTVHDMNNLEDAKIVFYVLAESVASRLKEQKLCGNCIQIGLRDTNLEKITRQCKINYYTNTSEDIMTSVILLLNKHYDFSTPLRSISVRVSNLCSEHASNNVEQLNMFSTIDCTKGNLKAKLIDQSMDEIRNKYGHKAVRRLITLIDEQLSDFDPKSDHTIFPVGFF